MATLYPVINPDRIEPDDYSTSALMRSRYAFCTGYLLVHELAVYYKQVQEPHPNRVGCRYKTIRRRFDYLVMGHWGQKSGELLIFEEKETVADLRREFENNYDKSACARDWGTRFYLILPATFKKHKVINEIPKSWGILWKYNKRLITGKNGLETENNAPIYLYGDIIGKYLREKNERERQQQIDLEYAEKKENV